MAKKLLLGIGNPLRSDDGAGSYIAQHFKANNWTIIDGKSAPENFTSVIINIHPELLIIVDTVEMELKAGSIRVIPPAKIVSLQLSTHYLPISYLIEYLSLYCQKIILIGIQPLSTKIGEGLSEPVLEACHLIISLLQEDKLNTIPILI